VAFGDCQPEKRLLEGKTNFKLNFFLLTNFKVKVGLSNKAMFLLERLANRQRQSASAPPILDVIGIFEKIKKFYFSDKTSIMIALKIMKCC
jgi:hypothetical protein